MSNKIDNAKLPVGGKDLHPERAELSIELAAQLAHRGASESLVRAIGGDDAVAKFFDGEPESDSSAEPAASQALPG